MLILIALPVLVAVAAVHRYLQFYAPTNVLARRVRTAFPTFRMVLALLAFAAVLLVLMHVIAGSIAAGAPGWLNLVVLVLAWDTLKVGCLALAVGLRRISVAARRAAGARHRVALPAS
ncbi:hypothetical protein [Nocardioides sambongensis]|uniref:hypothetical protein n=1 Tax=Nocardioides sambongensis TaxID=2589074 RepID=UPI00112EADB3|nr:hypothetical protein [Nocardioides sambongensis]